MHGETDEALARGRDCLARARAAAPAIAAEAARIEEARQLTPPALAAMHEARLFRLLLPRRLGGDELDPVHLAQVAEIVAAADASAAWCMGQSTGCAMSAAYMDPEPAARVFGGAEDVLAWGAGAMGRADAVPGGFRVTGAWQFASGSRHATWLGGHCKVYEPDGTMRLRADGRPRERTMLFRREIATIRDVWQVMGLRGTGSDSYAVEDLFVPAELTLDREEPLERQETGTVYRVPTTLVFAAAFSGVALGIARASLDALLALARDKTPRGAAAILRDSPGFQAEAAQLEAKLGAARQYLLHNAGEVWRDALAGGELSLDRRVAMRLAVTFAINQATEVTAAVYRAAGATAIFDTAPFERRFRDAHAVSQQVQARPTHYVTVGRHMVGLEPDTTLFLY